LGCLRLLGDKRDEGPCGPGIWADQLCVVPGYWLSARVFRPVFSVLFDISVDPESNDAKVHRTRHLPGLPQPNLASRDIPVGDIWVRFSPEHSTRRIRRLSVAGNENGGDKSVFKCSSVAHWYADCATTL